MYRLCLALLLLGCGPAASAPVQSATETCRATAPVLLSYRVDSGYPRRAVLDLELRESGAWRSDVAQAVAAA
jgi:hypothetical protein